MFKVSCFTCLFFIMNIHLLHNSKCCIIILTCKILFNFYLTWNGKNVRLSKNKRNRYYVNSTLKIHTSFMFLYYVLCISKFSTSMNYVHNENTVALLVFLFVPSIGFPLWLECRRLLEKTLLLQ